MTDNNFQISGCLTNNLNDELPNKCRVCRIVLLCMLFDVVERVQEQRTDFIIVCCVFTWTGGGKCAPYYTADRTGDC